MRRIGCSALGVIAGAVVGLSGCASPEEIGYGNTFIGESDGEIVAIINYPHRFGRGGVTRVEFYNENGDLIYTDNLPELVPFGEEYRGHRSYPENHRAAMNVNDAESADKEIGRKIIIKVIDPKENSFEKTFERVKE